MIRLLQLVFLGHFHRWDTVEVRNFFDRRDEGKANARPIGQVYVQQCKGCGKVVRRNLY